MRWALSLTFFILAALTLVVSLVRRDNIGEPRLESYPAMPDAPDAFYGLGVFDARLWLGASIAFGVAGVVSFVTARLAPERLDAA
jgi:hypothetical protein